MLDKDGRAIRLGSRVGSWILQASSIEEGNAIPNPWQKMTTEDGRAMDERQDRAQVRVKHTVLWDLIQTHLPEDRASPILDLGGGTGVWALPIAEAGYRVVLTDISPGLLDRAREKVDAAGLKDRIEIREADIRDLSAFDDASFPLALVLGDPLSYCGDAELALREILRVTDGSGVLIGDVENRYRGSLSSRRAATWADAREILLEGVARWPDPGMPHDIRKFATEELKGLLRETGWTVEAMYPSDIVANTVSAEILQEADDSEAVFREMVEAERVLRNDQTLLALGNEIQFVCQPAGDG